jgi:hypothetical protein
MAKFILTPIQPQASCPDLIRASILNRHSGARALRKIDEVNFVAERANPESRTVHGAGFRVCAQEGASRNDEVEERWIAASSPAMTMDDY